MSSNTICVGLLLICNKYEAYTLNMQKELLQPYLVVDVISGHVVLHGGGGVLSRFEEQVEPRAVLVHFEPTARLAVSVKYLFLIIVVATYTFLIMNRWLKMATLIEKGEPQERATTRCVRQKHQ